MFYAGGIGGLLYRNLYDLRKVASGPEFHIDFRFLSIAVGGVSKCEYHLLPANKI